MIQGPWRQILRVAVLALPLLGGLAPAAAGPLEDARDACDRGDCATWLQMLRPLAEQGDAEAQVNLGIAYANGRGVAKDDREAARWYRLAAEQGHAAAQLALGASYTLGRGVPKDLVRAYLWFNLAAAQGDETVGEPREWVAKRMTRDQIAEAQRLSSEWRPTKGGVPKRE